MGVFIHILKAAGQFKNYSGVVEKNSRLSIEKIEKKIPVSDVDIVFYDNPAGVIPELGIGWYSPNPHTVFISLDPVFKNFRQTIDTQIERILAHEFHHCARAAKVGYGKTLFEALVTEGLADHFEIEVTGKNPQMWDRVLTDKQIEKYLDLVQRELDHKNYNHHDWFYGSKERHIPRWAGYTLGYWIVGEYLKKHPDKKPSQIYDISADEFKVK